ncbi:hypothetical protein [Sphingomonas sanxanigenens]|uniref:Transmembrane protein n=1 Tax=Sphingomonas sanxanigenens DSM 19645 = NX02 TaxID=1123269 RepID=W0AKP6_9SPHN|nr:hypothetical protein [Sphingomonas sanxanigenens]AHE57127.1 hypothetical protein NX02_27720 [Sphingomonas sanxanigenens DSM 19645 = NX02]
MTTDHDIAAAEALCGLTDAQLSLPARIGHGLLLLAALGMTSAIASLWLTEPALPAHTRLAFGAMVPIGAAWVVYAGWVLARRHVLFARHRIVAGRMALLFALIFTGGALAIGLVAGRPAGLVAAVPGVGMIAAAILLLVSAHRRVAALTHRLAMLEARDPSVRR